MRRCLVLACILFGLATPLLAQTPPPDPSSPAQLAPPRAYLPAIMGGLGVPLPLPPPDEAASRITLPADFAIRVYADGLGGTPRLMDFGPDGSLYVALRGAGQVARLPDRNRDGKSDGVEIVAGNLSGPHNLEWRGDWMYVAENDKIERLRDANRDGQAETRELVTANIPDGGGHSSRTLHFGPDGKLYVSAGSTGNNQPETDPRRAAILRFNADGSIPDDNPFAKDPDSRKRAVWAVGLRNSVDFLWTPSGQLWANHNGSDGLGDDLPPEEVVIPVEGGKHYGWPYCYTPGVGPNLPPQRAEVRDNRVALPAGFNCSMATPALVTDLAHSAPLGMARGHGGNFPESWRDDLYIAYHGSWNTSPASYRDCKVQRIVLENGVPQRAETFATGWRAPGENCGSGSSWGRPADVAFGPDGAMYISDDKSGRIYRVIYVGQ